MILNNYGLFYGYFKQLLIIVIVILITIIAIFILIIVIVIIVWYVCKIGYQISLNV